jgi:hypothetical protein
MDTMWLAWWDNGFSYDDQRIELVGVFTSKRRANTAGKKYKNIQAARDKWYERSSWSVEEVPVNKISGSDE